jgi:tRNA(adenine34) deaminase
MEKINDEAFMRMAIQEAEIASRENSWPIGCVIVIDGKIVAKAHNTEASTNNRLNHAETLALFSAIHILDENKGRATVYTTYSPCPMCFGALVISKIQRLVVGIDINQSGAISMQEHLPPFFQQEKFHFSVTTGVLEKECEDVFLKGKIVEEHKQKAPKLYLH